MFKLNLKDRQGFKIIHQTTGEKIEFVFEAAVNPAGQLTGNARILLEADEDFIILREGQSLDEKLAALRRKETQVGSFDDTIEDRPGHFDYMLDQ